MLKRLAWWLKRIAWWILREEIRDRELWNKVVISAAHDEGFDEGARQGCSAKQN